jgi:hypothetical protein
MRKAHQILAGILAAEVVIQAMAIAFALAGLGHWLEEDGGQVNKAVLDSWEDNPPDWTGAIGFPIHGMNGMMLIPLIAILLLVVSLFANKTVPGAAGRGAILFGMVALQVVLGLSLHDVVALAPLHALNGFGIFAMAIVTVRKASAAAPMTTTAVA